MEVLFARSARDDLTEDLCQRARSQIFLKRVAVLAMLVFTTGPWPASARAAFVTLGAPSSTLGAGGVARVELLIFNPSNEPVGYALPANLDGRLTKEGQTWLVTLQGGTGDVSIPAGGFV